MNREVLILLVLTVFCSGIVFGLTYETGDDVYVNFSTTYNSEGVYLNDSKMVVGNVNGSIDEVRVWNKSLSALEVLQMYMSNLNKYDSDGWLFYVKESSLDSGSYFYETWAGDDDGNWNSTGERSVNVFNSSGYFKSSWNTSKAGVSNSTSIALPLEAGGDYNFTVYWGDGTYGDVTAWDDVDANHTYSSEGVYDVSISGVIVGWRFNDEGDKLKILDVSQWGVLNVGNTGSYFYGCANLVGSASDNLNLSGTTNFNYLFMGASVFNGNISEWDVSNVSTMYSAFRGAMTFNGDISGWNVSSVTSMMRMFQSATSFNASIGNWDVSNVLGMDSMFYIANSFNQDLGAWNVSSVTDMEYMFRSASVFNGNISGWDVSSVNAMTEMFVSASSFDQDLGDWNVSSVTDMTDMFNAVTLSTENYDSLLIGWDSLASLQNDTVFSGGNSQYCLGASARQDLNDSWNWTVTDGGMNCSVPVISEVLDINETGVSDGDVLMGDNVTINVTLADDYGVDSVWVKVWEGAVGLSSVIYEGFLSLIGAVWTVTFGVNSSFGVGEVNYTVYANNTAGDEVNESGEFNVVNLVPDDPSPTLVAVDGLNLTSSDLNCSALISDVEGDSLNVTVKWYRDSVLYSVLDYLDSYVNGTFFSAILESGNTSQGEDWNCSMRVWDGWGESNPEIWFVWPTPLNGSSQSSDSIYVSYYVGDADGDDVYSFIDFDGSLVGWWRMDNDSSVGENDTLAYDWSGNGNNGTVVGGVSFIESGRFGGAGEFDGDDDYVLLPDASRPMNDFAISMWFKANQEPYLDPSYPNLIGGRSFGISTSGGGVALGFTTVDESQLRFETYNTTDVASTRSTTVTWNTSWHHVLVTRNSTTQELWINGIREDFDDTVSGDLYWNEGAIFRIAYGYRAYFNGSIDEVMIFNRSLSGEEIFALYNATKTYYNFTSLDVGNHNFTAYAVDADGALSYTEERIVGYS